MTCASQGHGGSDTPLAEKFFTSVPYPKRLAPTAQACGRQGLRVTKDLYRKPGVLRLPSPAPKDPPVREKGPSGPGTAPEQVPKKSQTNAPCPAHAQAKVPEGAGKPAFPGAPIPEVPDSDPDDQRPKLPSSGALKRHGQKKALCGCEGTKPKGYPRKKGFPEEACFGPFATPWLHGDKNFPFLQQGLGAAGKRARKSPCPQQGHSLLYKKYLHEQRLHFSCPQSPAQVFRKAPLPQPGSSPLRFSPSLCYG